jgi:hypothetical protein
MPGDTAAARAAIQAIVTAMTPNATTRATAPTLAQAAAEGVPCVLWTINGVRGSTATSATPRFSG